MSELQETEEAGFQSIDRSVKALAQRLPAGFFRLIGLEYDPARVRTEEVSVNLPEHRADGVFLIEEGDRRWALHLEYQLQPDRRVLPGWFLKNAALTAQLGVPVLLVAIFLRKGERTRFPGAYHASAGTLSNSFQFETVRLWEHAEEIRQGMLPELSPLLTLAEEEPDEETLRRELELIRALDVPEPVRADLISIAITVGSRFFGRDLLLRIFQEELQMLKEASFIEEWVLEGEARGALQATRSATLEILRAKFGDLPPSVVGNVEAADAARCREIMGHIFTAQSLEELGL